METLGAARLAKEIPAQRAVAAIVPREDIAAVLKDPESNPELFLRIASDDLDGTDDPSVIAMTWSRGELEAVLERASSENIVLTFDREELSQAIGDVEAHGLRERALVFAVVATGALGTGAGIANAMPTTDDGGPVATSVAPPVATANSLTDVSSSAGYTAQVAGTATAGATISDAASGAGYAAPAATAADARVTDASSSGGYGTVESTDSSGEFLGISRSDATDGLLAGGIVLAIAGATFASRHTGTPRPA